MGATKRGSGGGGGARKPVGGGVDEWEACEACAGGRLIARRYGEGVGQVLVVVVLGRLEEEERSPERVVGRVELGEERDEDRVALFDRERRARSEDGEDADVSVVERLIVAEGRLGVRFGVAMRVIGGKSGATRSDLLIDQDAVLNA